jgi:hypothetical protein
MDSTNVPRRSLRLVGWLAVWMASAALVSPTLAAADQLEQHNQLVDQFVNGMHADPLVADCAAHGSFVASTSTAFDHVEFAPFAFDSTHASVTPWNDSFDEGKQRVKVDNIVTVDGIGIRSGGGDPADLHFRCGYVGTQMLAFNWNDPVPPARRVETPAASPAGSYAAPGKTASKKQGGKAAKKSAQHSASHSSGKAAAKSSGKSSAKPASKAPASKSAGSHKAASSKDKKKH